MTEQSQAWRLDTKSSQVPINMKPDENGRVPLEQTLVEAGGVGHGEPLRQHYARSPYIKYPSMALLANKWLGQKLIVCGGGASIQKTLGRIRSSKKMSQKTSIIAVNKTHDFLVKRGIVPDFAMLVDPRPHVAGYVTPRDDVMYLLGLSLDDPVFEKFIDAKAAFAVFVALNDDKDQGFVLKCYPPERGFSHAFVTGLSTVGFRAVTAGNMLGFTDFELHGFDSCYSPFPDAEAMTRAYTAAQMGGKAPTALPGLYAYDKPESDYEMHDVTFQAHDDSTFRFFGNNNMTVQARSFKDFVLNPNGWKYQGKYLRQTVKVAGDGVIPWMAYKMGIHCDMKAMDKKYGKIKDFDYRCCEKVTVKTDVMLRQIERHAFETRERKPMDCFTGNNLLATVGFLQGATPFNEIYKSQGNAS